ncbi:MAG: NADH:flavin oxidoreductase [Lentisphaerae bacterium]|nr:NADH:flavin oxidoreductase [Lentisphaerota bacterium]
MGNCAIKNRTVRSATYEGMGTLKGFNTPELTEKMRELAANNVGLIISGHTYVSPEGKSTSHKIGADRDEVIPGLKEMTLAVHDEGGKIFMQLAHGGGQLMSSDPGIGPSAYSSDGKRPPCKEMTEADIKRVIKAFGDAAIRAKKADFDGVQIHAAHGYLLSEFLSPYYNKRTDNYGGSIENRARIVMEVYADVRSKVGKDYPVAIKINSRDFVKDGLTLDDSMTVCKMLEEAGLDAIELSGGVLAENGGRNPAPQGDLKPEQEIYNREEALRFKTEINIPLILVGGIRYFETAEKIIADGMADFVSFCRPLIREPDLIHRWQNGDHSRAKCISCNLCFRPVFTGKGLYCELEARLRRKQKK